MYPVIAGTKENTILQNRFLKEGLLYQRTNTQRARKQLRHTKDSTIALITKKTLQIAIVKTLDIIVIVDAHLATIN